MSLRETHINKVVPGSLWKYLNSDKPHPNEPNSNPDYMAGKVLDGCILFGRYPRDNSYEYSGKDFLKELIPIREESVRDRTRLLTILSQLHNIPCGPHEIEELIVELDI